MEYKYMCDVKPADIWKMAMVRTYKSPIGLVNIVFTVAMILLTLKFFGTSSDLLRILMIFGCLVFPVIQPLATYGMSVKQLEDLPKNMELTFNDKGVHVETSDKSEDIKWNRIANAIKRNNMIVVMSDDSHGYMFTNRVLGDQKEEFYNFLCSKIRG
ncbi:YcxB family protein [Butyrivibrio sp. CB08]|uniref:YcxB family protein n=1 Tax=Butyrivibrio sp. CB08 TaxID=2364879 RepID=UPI000EA89F01|nr:YcxB family protein [Butyrivibrio sp. CB08]RKM59768.1 YcxB family protein [Butyrivibrio sp. CB08]